MANYVTKIKDPDEDLDYTWDFSAVLDTGEIIADYEFVDAPDDDVVHDDTSEDTEVTAFVGPYGTPGTEFLLTCRVTTNATPPRIFDRSIKFRLETK